MSARVPAAFHRLLAQAVARLALAQAMRCEFIGDLGEGVALAVVASLLWEVQSCDVLLRVHCRATGRLVLQVSYSANELWPRWCDPDTLPAGLGREIC